MTSSNKLFHKEARRRNRENDTDMGKVEMRPRDPYEILGIKKPKPQVSKPTKGDHND